MNLQEVLRGNSVIDFKGNEWDSICWSDCVLTEIDCQLYTTKWIMRQVLQPHSIGSEESELVNSFPFSPWTKDSLLENQR